MHNSSPAYGLWGVMILNALVFIFFAASFTRTSGEPRLAIARALLGLRRRAVHGDVWFPADDLPPFGMVGRNIFPASTSGRMTAVICWK